MPELHYMADDLGFTRDALSASAVETEPSWLDTADVMLEHDVRDRLRAEVIMDEFGA